MKFFNKNIWAVALASLALASCNDLDTEPTGSILTDKQKQETLLDTPEKASASVNAIFSISSNLSQTTSYHYDIGLPTIFMATDHRGTDLVSSDIGYNWYAVPLTFSDISIGSGYVRTPWRLLYIQILATNNVIKNIDAETTNDVSKFNRAQALAMRAYDYFYLAQLYQQTYVGHEDALCVPIITEKNSDEAALNGMARAKVKEVYAQIIADLDEAVKLLTGNSTARKDRRYVDLAVAYGLRARVNLVMNNWAAAASDAQSAIDNTDATPTGLTEANKPAFADLAEKNWMWGIYYDETYAAAKGVVSFASHMGSFSYGYASVGSWSRVSKKLYNAIPTTDVRKGWFLDANKTSANLTTEQKKYLAGKGAVAYTQVKFNTYNGVLGQSTNANDIPLMRVEEMYLIKAEAQAMSGDVAGGLATLTNFVKTYRNASYNVTATTAAEVQDLVWFQRRVELWGEGFSYFDILRLKKGIDRRGAGFDAPCVFNIPAESAIMVYPVPQEEIQGNDKISDKDQNPLGTTPSPVADN
ncbi:MAG: RagB/SusD family nutrient uptake outer membrane protein [Alloprevotella sp.]|nr:RagB/SusD family nutrient uptake outer membrane protein [Alloprevotella sp.]